MGAFTDYAITFSRGDSYAFRFVVKIDGVVQDITAWQKFWFTAKRAVTDAYASSVIALTDEVSGGITRFDPPNGVGEVKFTPALTSGLPASRRDLTLVSDVQGMDAAGDVWTLLRGTVTIPTDVTDVAT